MGRPGENTFQEDSEHISISLAEQLKLMQKVTELTVMEFQREWWCDLCIRSRG